MDVLRASRDEAFTGQIEGSKSHAEDTSRLYNRFNGARSRVLCAGSRFADRSTRNSHMINLRCLACTALLATTLTSGLEAGAQTIAPPEPVPAAANPQARAPRFEARAIDLLRAMSASLTGAKSLAF